MNDAEVKKVYLTYKTTIECLLKSEIKEWDSWFGNIVAGSKTEATARFYASYRFGAILVVMSRTLTVDSLGKSDKRVVGPFDSYYLKSVVERLSRIIENWPKQGEAKTSETVAENYLDFTEWSDWQTCQDLWRNTFGEHEWLAIKHGQVRASAPTLEKLREKVRELDLDPPVLYASARRI